MSDIGKQALKTKINSKVYENSSQAITGAAMNEVLQDMVDTLCDGANLDAGSVTDSRLQNPVSVSQNTETGKTQLVIGDTPELTVDFEPTAGSKNLVESGGVKEDSICNDFFFKGSGNNFVWAEPFKVTPNQKYRVLIKNPNISMEGVTGGYILSINTSNASFDTAIKNVPYGTSLNAFYDVIVPSDASVLYIGGRCKSGEVFTFYVLPIVETNKYDVVKEMYVIGGNSTYRVYVKKKTNDYLYCRIIDSSDNMVCASDYYISNLPPVLKVAEINSSGVTAYIVIDYNYVPYDDNNYYTYSYAGNYRLLGDNPSVNTYLNVTPKLDCSSLIGNFFSNSIVGDIELKQFFKELYIKGLDVSTSYCLRTLRNTGSGFQINIGTSSASVLQIDISAGNIYGYAQSGNIEAHIVLQNTDKIVGSLIFANTDTTICSINKTVCGDLANSPYISNIVNGGYIVPESFNGFSLPKNPSTLKILSIGNSFVDHPMTKLKYWLDAIGITQVYYGKVSKSGGTLQQHLAGLNTTYDANFAISESNGTTQNNWKFVDPATGQDGEVQIKLSDALKFTDWDIITFQQASGDSGKMNTITPYLPSLIQAARYYCPNAGVKIGWHQTWAFAAGYDDLSLYSDSQETMFDDIVDVSKQMCQKYGLDLIIPNAVVMQHLRNIPNSYWGADLLTIKGYDTYTQEHQNADFCIDGKHPNYFAEFCLCASFVQMLINCCFNKTILGEGGDAGIWKDDYIITGVQCVLKAVGNRFSLSQITT